MARPDSLERLPDLTADAHRVARLALDEDGPRDLTTEVAGDPDGPASGVLMLRGRGVVAGLAYAEVLASEAGCALEWMAEVGQAVDSAPIGRISGTSRSVLRAERPLLNLLQRASGIATRTRAFVDALTGTGCTLLHTRKTVPGLRLFDIAAVVAGGGGIHRLDLARTVMIKDNHWRVVRRSGRPLAAVLAAARRQGALACLVEVETEDQVREACEAGADRLLIDNQAPATVAAWGRVARSLRPAIAIEATGGITLENARDYAMAEADYISVGEITHSPRAADIALEFD